MAIEIPQRVADRIFDRVDRSGGPDACWPFQGHIGTHGYGGVGWTAADGRTTVGTTAHRVAWTATHGRIPGELTIDHLCRNQPCCNPAHLRLLSRSENSRLNGQAVATHCKRGHEFTPENTYLTPSEHRRCWTCIRAWHGRPPKPRVPLPPGALGDKPTRVLLGLIDAYAEAGRATQRSIATKADASTETVLRRLREMREMGLVAFRDRHRGTFRPLVTIVPFEEALDADPAGGQS